MKLYMLFKKHTEECEEIVVEEDEWDDQIPLHKNKKFVKSKASPPKWTRKTKVTIVKN